MSITRRHLGAAALGTGSAAANSLGKAKRAGELTIAIEMHFAPFDSTKGGRETGLNAELFEERAMPAPFLLAEKLERRVGDTQILAGIDLFVQKGEVVRLIGPSGSAASAASIRSPAAACWWKAAPPARATARSAWSSSSSNSGHA
jgi:ABC-type amino acid transport substrate-binding protein